MDWEHKGIRFSLSIAPAGAFFLATARAAQEGMFIRVRPFSALGKSEDEALALLKDQIKLEYHRIPSPLAD